MTAFTESVTEESWRQTTVAGIIKAAGVGLADYYREFDGKASLARALSRQVTAEALANLDTFDPDDPPRDRLFEVLMARFDALNPIKETVRAIVRASPSDPMLAAEMACATGHAMAQALDAAKLPSGGLLGPARVQALGLAYLSTVRVWLADDTPDMAKTMAHLDRQLGRLGRLAAFLDRDRTPPSDQGEAGQAQA
ncbi:MAG: hypothetical protein MI755_11750 [Sphingomonadales bacterium]|nr:hypothetical protein [Sphingomonadales bacterium]